MERENIRDAGEGILTVAAVTAEGALPLSGVQVTVYAGKEPIFNTMTDKSGKTPPLYLPTPSPTAGLSPDGGPAFSVYRITAKKEGFYPYENTGVPVFPGIGALQPIGLIPVSPFGGGIPPKGSTYFSAGQALAGGDGNA